MSHKHPAWRTNHPLMSSHGAVARARWAAWLVMITIVTCFAPRSARGQCSLNEEVKLTASDSAANDLFGNSVSLSGDTAVIGAWANDDAGTNSGSAYVFILAGGVWTQQQKLTAIDGAAGDAFGISVGISGDTAIVGANGDDDAGSNAGSVYILTRSGGVWSGVQTKFRSVDTAAGDGFGGSVAISGDTVLIGATGSNGVVADSGAAYVFTRSGSSWTQQQKLTASDGAASDLFGRSVSLFGDTAIVAAPFDDDGGSGSGSAYVFTRSGGVWTQQAKLTALDDAANDNFGWSVSLSGTTALVGAYNDDDMSTNSGSVYVFGGSSGIWTQQAKLSAADPSASANFGVAVSVSGNVAVIAAPGDDAGGTDTGSAYVFTRSGGIWTEQAKLSASDGALGDQLGSAIAVSGDTAIVATTEDDDAGASSGSAYIFNVADCSGDGVLDDCEPDCNSNDISDVCEFTESKLTAADAAAGDQFGFSASIDGDTAAVGSPFDDDGGTSTGSVYVYTRSGGVWTQQAKLTASDPAADDRFGFSVAVFGSTIAVGARLDDDGGASAGSVYIFTRSGGVWTQQQKLTASDAAAGDEFGQEVAGFGDTLVVGSPFDDDVGSNSGSAYVFTRSGSVWTQQQKLAASDSAAGDEFGLRVHISGETAIVGSHLDDDGGSESGAAYVFTRSGGIWAQQQKLTAADAAAGDRFGRRVQLSGDTAIVGASWDDDGGTNAGAAYVFTRSGAVWTQQQKLTAPDAAAGNEFGEYVSVSGHAAIVGARFNDAAGTDAGAAYVFIRSGGVWTQRIKLNSSDIAGGDRFGGSVWLSGDTAIVGANLDDDAGSSSGSAYIFDTNDCDANGVLDACEPDSDGDGVIDACDVCPGGDDTLDCNNNGTPDDCEPAGVDQFKLTASDAAADDTFGFAVSISGGVALVGASGDDDVATNSGSAYVFARSGAAWTQQAKLTALDGQPADRFGDSVAVHADTAVVGAPYDDNKGRDAGAAYVFAWSGGAWTQQAKLTAADGKDRAGFGTSVSISGDTLIVGAHMDDAVGFEAIGAAYVFIRSGGIWTQQAKLTASDGLDGDNFGYSVCIAGDTVVVGSLYDVVAGIASGSAYVFTRTGGVWTQQAKLTAVGAASGDLFGVAVSVAGDTIVVGDMLDDDGGPDSGSAYVFTRSGGVWTQQAKLTASDAATTDFFGASVCISGSRVVVGSWSDNDAGTDSGSVYVFTRSGGVWTQSQKLAASDGAASDQFGRAVGLAGSTLIIGAGFNDDAGSNSGAGYIFSATDCNSNGVPDECEPDTDGDGWIDDCDNCPVIANSGQQDADNDTLGDLCDNCPAAANAGQVDCDDDGMGDACEADCDSNGTPNDCEPLLPQSKLTAPDAAGGDHFGQSVAVSGHTAIVGVNRDDDAGTNSGAAHVFVLSGGVWTQQVKLTAADAAASDEFGHSVAISGDTAVVGAYLDDDAGASSGSAYVFVRVGGVWSQQAKLTATDAALGDQFGYSVAISNDTVIIGANRDDDGGSSAGSAYVFTRIGATWTQQAKLTASDPGASDQFGYSVNLSGDTAAVGSWGDDDLAGNSGALYVFTRTGGVWTQQAKLKASDAGATDNLGISLAIAGDTIVAGSYLDDDAGTNSGSAYVFARTGGAWSQQAKLTAADAAAGDQFGVSAAISGGTIVVGAWVDGDAGYASGSAYVFRRSGGVWTQAGKLTAADGSGGELFGASVAVSGVTAVAGAVLDFGPGNESGSAYVFKLGDCNANGVPDGCEPDTDGDGVIDDCDNCLTVANLEQATGDGDSLGDACDNCPNLTSESQADVDSDGLGDVCDPCPNRRPGDISGDSLVNVGDVGPFVAVLLDPDAATADERCAADVNESGWPDGADVQAFMNLLIE